MPCPYFEPRERSSKSLRNARLPLIDEYKGMCHARAGQPAAVPAEMIAGPCSHGYSRGTCSQYPADTKTAAMRYSVLRQSDETLDLVCIEEAGYAPVRWHALQYSKATGLLAPDVGGECMKAQAIAFCRSYLGC